MNDEVKPPFELPPIPMGYFDSCPREFEDKFQKLLEEYAGLAILHDRDLNKDGPVIQRGIRGDGSETPKTKDYFTPLDPSFKKRWVEALRSGQYKQGFDFLKQRAHGGVQFTAIGVAKDLQMPHWKLNTANYFMDLKTGESMNYIAATGEFEIDPEALAHLNNLSSEGETFLGMANWIEENL